MVASAASSDTTSLTHRIVSTTLDRSRPRLRARDVHLSLPQATKKCLSTDEFECENMEPALQSADKRPVGSSKWPPVPEGQSQSQSRFAS
jgi:hypothetical protein